MPDVGKKQRLIKNTFIVGIGSLASKGIIFLMAPLFSRWLSVEEYGSFDLITTYVSLLLPFCTLSIAEAVFRFLLDDVNECNKKRIISSGLFIAFLGYGIFLFFYWIVSQIWNKKHFGWTVLLLLFSQMLSTFLSEVARGMKKMELYSLFGFISVVLLSFFSSLFLIGFKWGLNGIVLGYSFAYLIAAIGLFFTTKCYRYISIKYINIKSILGMLKYSWPLIPNSISWWVVNVSDRLIINNFIGIAANGIYAVANKIPAIVNVLFSVFHISWVQSASETVSDEDYSAYCNMVFNELILFIFSAASVFISGNYLFYRFIFDANKYFEAYYYSPILIVAASVSCVGQFMGGIMIAKKETKQNGTTNVVAAISNIIINLFMVHQFGLYAASISTLLAYLILVICRYFMIQKYVNLYFEKKSLLVIFIEIVIFIGVYFINAFINILLLCFAVAHFAVINKNLIVCVRNILLKRK